MTKCDKITSDNFFSIPLFQTLYIVVSTVMFGVGGLLTNLVKEASLLYESFCYSLISIMFLTLTNTC